MKAKAWLLPFFILLFSILGSGYAQAVCPVCTVAVVGGLGLSRWLGIDDFITAIWIGGLALSITAWSWNYLKKKDKLNALNGILAFVVVYLATFFPLYWLKYIGAPLNKLWGQDKLVLGIIVGTVVFWLGAFLHTWLKKRNEGKVYVKFQRVILPVGFLLVASLAYYAYCKCYNLF
jgi:hypothetical protein